MEDNKNTGRKMFADKNLSRSGHSNEDRLLGVHSRIAEQLRAFYTGIQEEAIPQKFLTLLEQLDEAEKNENNTIMQTGGQHNFTDPPGPAEKNILITRRRSRHE
ncbi:NepR family anti-sigma factor [Candidatus Tokpelaia sp.]|uniref:NepR family anti-sigma factor n=1 Tax=Candidatus Tokpelaia sp. TaxID=2233777 RepID=UPI002A4E1312|nr:NepR family anti-sigma factor [Candidatus Tokpelaia sp.]